MQDNIETIISQYQLGISISNIAKANKVSERTIQRRLISKNVWVKGKLPVARRKSRHSYNEKFFDEINNEISAYWLGFIAADGCITIDSKNRHYLRFHLKLNDACHLEKLNKSLNATYPIIKHKNSCCYTVCGKHIVEKLVEKGITPRKTNTLIFPNIKNNLISHFCRGYFDGDGCWHIDRKKSPVFNVTGNHKFINTFQEILVENCNLNKTKLRLHNNGHSASLVYGGKHQCRRIYNFLYKEASIFMDRKKDIISSLTSELPE